MEMKGGREEITGIMQKLNYRVGNSVITSFTLSVCFERRRERERVEGKQPGFV